ncbi:leucine-rich repeat domain-containing protein [Moheibacter sediminis]|uniref:Leucine rich repeat-containing protein n=1 Tax=Moheibacter sediminis TaxID=1434700 RepID=A0A1W1ZVL3_9FLAO|nr:leucine-rich repeat domain-containing protein [Moheibacter sediminis]SMC52413.1 Leucine rich repeat-containing protein [Moheibacter sediminis]
MKKIKIILSFLMLSFVSNVYSQEEEFLSGKAPESEFVYSLHLYSKGLKELPDNFSAWKEIEILILDDNELNTLPPSIKKLTKLRELSIPRNQFTSFPEEILELKNLKTLDVANNSIQNIPDEIGSLSQLEYLLISETGIKNLPESICRLKNLEMFALSSNQLKTLPDCLKDMPKLQYLYVGENQFESFPSVITELVHLKTLDIEQKKSFEIPAEIKNLKDLEIIYIDKNYYQTNKSKIDKLLPKKAKVNPELLPPPIIEPIIETETQDVFGNENCLNFTEKIKNGDIVKESLYTLDFSGNNVYAKLVKESSEYNEKDKLEAEKEGYTIVSAMDIEFSNGNSEIKNGNLIFTPANSSDVKTFKIKYEKDSKTIKELIDSKKQVWNKGNCYAAPPSIGF